MRNTMGITMLAGLLGLAGCMDDRYGGSRSGYGYDAPSETPPPPTVTEPGSDAVELPFQNARISGDMGTVMGFDEEPYEVSAVRIGDIDFLRVDAIDDGSGSWVMAQVEIQGRLDHRSLEPGASLELEPFVGTGGLSANGVGCTGPEPGNFDYDSAPRSVNLQVHEASRPGYLRYDFDLVFDDHLGHRVTDVSIEVAPHGDATASEPRVTSVALDGTLEGTSFGGEATWVGQHHAADASTVLFELDSDDPATLPRARLHVEGGLGALGPGAHGSPDGSLKLAASTAPLDVDPGYPLEPSTVVAEVTDYGDGARSLVLEATFEGGDTLSATVTYDVR